MIGFRLYCIALIFAWGMRAVAMDVLTRTVERTAVPAGSNLNVTVTFTNTSKAEVHGYFYSEQLPPAVEVISSAIQINGRGITNYVFERGIEDDVYPGYVPARWTLETPTDFLADNSLPAGGSFKLTYSLTSSTNGLFRFGDEGYAGYIPTNTYSFGLTSGSNSPTFGFLPAGQAPAVLWQRHSNEVIVCVNGMPGLPYVLDASADMRSWNILATNISPFTWLDRQPSAASQFYRGRALAAAALARLTVLQSGGHSTVSLTGVPGCVYVIETSSNLATWTAALTNSSPVSFVVTNLTGGPRFYRGRWLP